MPPIQNKPTSKVWRYFGEDQVQDDGQYTQCLLCKYHPVKGVVLHVKLGAGGSTQAMRNHIMANHMRQFIHMENEERGEKKQHNPLGLKESVVTPKVALRKLKTNSQIKQSNNDITEERSRNQILTDTISSQMTKTGTHLQIGNKSAAEYSCKLCQKRGLESNVFMHIQQTHQGKNTGKPCKQCGKLERSKFAMTTHMGKMHARKHIQK